MSVLRRIVTASGGLALTLLAAPIIALHAQVVAPGTNPQSPTTTPAPTKTNPNPTSPSAQADIRADLPFLRVAASANLMEVRLGQVAQSRASDPAVKSFGQRMVSDHSSLQQQLTTMTSSNGVAVTPTLDYQQQQDINRLQGLYGSEFDRAYIQLMIQDHQQDVDHFQNEARANHSTPVQNLISTSLPVLQQHLSLAQQVGRQLNIDIATVPPRRTKVAVPPQNGQVTNPSAQPASTTAESADVRADRKFIHEVAADNMLEVRMAQLAQRRAESPAVKQFADQVVSDHERMQNDWVGMASRNGYQFQPGIGKNHRKKLTQLEKLSGRAFDRAYLTTVVQDHRDYIEYLEKEGPAAHSSQVRQLADRDLSTLRSHFDQGKRIGSQVGANVNVTLRSER